MNRSLFVALLLAFLCCVLSAPVSAQTTNSQINTLCAQCHDFTFLQKMTAGNAYNCNFGNEGLTQCGWVPLARPADNQGGMFAGVTAFGGAIYAVGYAVRNGTNDFLIEKYDEAGNRIWSQTSGGPGDDELNDVVAVGSNLYAVGFTTSQGAGGKDIVVLQIDPNTGNTIKTTLYGGANDDIAQSAATDGTDLYVVGTSNSFSTPAGNQEGQNDVILVRYKTE
jgi:hypothetical protein